jgi:hypothetical protein
MRGEDTCSSNQREKMGWGESDIVDRQSEFASDWGQ